MSAPRKILVVDDDVQIREYLLRVLSEFGFQVETAPDARRALKEAAQFNPDMALLDINLRGGVDGIELCAELKKLPACRDTRILMLTVLGDRETVARSIQAGAVDFVVKPFKAPGLLRKIRKHFGEVDPVSPQPVAGVDVESEVEEVEPVAIRPMRGSGLAARQEIGEDAESDGLIAAGKEG